MNKKYLSDEELIEMEKNLKIDSAETYWKALVLGFITNMLEVEDYSYKLSEIDIKVIVDSLLNNDTIFEVIDEHISYELMNFERRGRNYGK